MKQEEKEYAIYKLRQTRKGNRLLFVVSLVVSIASFILFGFHYWWSIPVIVLLFSILEILMCIFGLVAHISLETTDLNKNDE